MKGGFLTRGICISRTEKCSGSSTIWLIASKLLTIQCPPLSRLQKISGASDSAAA